MWSLPDSLLLELCRIDEELEPSLAAPIYDTPAEADEIAELCRSGLMDWCYEALRHEGMEPAAHHRLLIDHLQAVADGQISKLMVFMPPGSAKSKYVSELFPAWFMAHCPGEPIIAASHTARLAIRFSGRVQRYVRAFQAVLGYGLMTEAKDRWENTHNAEYLAATVGSSLPGFRAKVAIVDDPYKGREDADSENTRESVWEWWNGDLSPRLKPDAGLILMHTRYHEDDQAARLLAAEPNEWTVLSLPAVAEDPAASTPENIILPDALGRAPGVPIWADDPKYPFGDLMLKTRDALARRGATREWQSQYQQRPRPTEGALFHVSNIAVLEIAPNLRGAHVGRGWDLAATRKIGTNDPDWTVGIKLARMASGLYVVLDVERFRGGPDEVDTRIKNVADQDGPIKVGLPQDPGQAGKAQVLAFTRLLSGHRIESSVETGDKATRAAPAISQVNGGNFAIVAAPWNRAFLDELSAFPAGVKDDQVDALSRAFSLVGLGAGSLIVTKELLAAMATR
jgi:predicted phage terminase large subunit-like protein